MGSYPKSFFAASMLNQRLMRSMRTEKGVSLNFADDVAAERQYANGIMKYHPGSLNFFFSDGYPSSTNARSKKSHSLTGSPSVQM